MKYGKTTWRIRFAYALEEVVSCFEILLALWWFITAPNIPI